MKTTHQKNQLGCKNGICIHANFDMAKKTGRPDGICFCASYGKYVESRESCQFYSDFFDSPMGSEFISYFKQK